MTDYDERSAELVAKGLEYTALDVRAEAEQDEADGPDEHPYDYVDSESLASYNLRIIRRELGLSQQQIADRLPVVSAGKVRLAQTQIAKIERGERPWRVNEMFAIAEALGVSWNEFFRVLPGDVHDDSHLVMLGARNKYALAQAKADEAKRAWVEAASEELRAGMAMAHTAAELGIDDPTVRRFLEFRGATLVFMNEENSAAQEGWRDFNLEEREREIKERGQRAWERLLDEVQDRKEGDSDDKEDDE
ncbi:helix-turn-helix transcriptional regulator [Streptomyces roseolus]|uniref:helix-turn-helix transcriptional regulator n=1 Tax=Streptomyces roseolus TaxID=67358 RepID=UPI0037917BA1